MAKTQFAEAVMGLGTHLWTLPPQNAKPMAMVGCPDEPMSAEKQTKKTDNSVLLGRMVRSAPLLCLAVGDQTLDPDALPPHPHVSVGEDADDRSARHHHHLWPLDLDYRLHSLHSPF